MTLLHNRTRALCALAALVVALFLGLPAQVPAAHAAQCSQQLEAQISSVSSASLTLKWNTPAGFKAVKCVVYRQKGSAKKKAKASKGLKPSAHRFKISGLKKDKTYRYVVRAWNAAGQRLESNTVFAKTAKSSKNRNVKTVKLKKKSFKLMEQDTANIAPTLVSYSGKKPISSALSFCSSDESVATVSSTGTVTAVGPGTCKIRCTAHNGKKATATVTVQRGITVLAYHGIATPEEKETLYPNDTFTITTTEFERQMKLLRDEGYRSISCDEFFQWRNGELDLPRKSVLITFDDARYVAVKNAPDILDEYGMKSMWFVIGERTQDANASDSHRYTAAVEDLKDMVAEHPSCELGGHAYGLHNQDPQTREPVICQKTEAEALSDFLFLRHFWARYGLGTLEYFAYPYGKDPEQYRAAASRSGLKMAFDFGNQVKATQTSNIWSIPRIGIKTTMTQERFDAYFTE